MNFNEQHTLGTNFRTDTLVKIERARGMVRVFFSDSVYRNLDSALKCRVSIDNIPNEDFEIRRSETILAMAVELGIAKT